MAINSHESEFVIQESRVTLGNGARKRDLVVWDCIWNVPAELIGASKTRQIIATSKVSRADAIQKANVLVEEFLSNK